MGRICCFSGHRTLPKEEIPVLRARLRREIQKLEEQGICEFVSGGAMGFDTLAAQTVLEAREEGYPVKLYLMLPCREQEKHWAPEDIDLYNAILAEADDIIFVSESYFRGCMQKRNRMMVDRSSICLCYLTEDRGGTAYTVQYCEKQGVPCINLA